MSQRSGGPSFLLGGGLSSFHDDFTSRGVSPSMLKIANVANTQVTLGEESMSYSREIHNGSTIIEEEIIQQQDKASVKSIVLQKQAKPAKSANIKVRASKYVKPLVLAYRGKTPLNKREQDNNPLSQQEEHSMPVRSQTSSYISKFENAGLRNTYGMTHLEGSNSSNRGGDKYKTMHDTLNASNLDKKENSKIVIKNNEES